MAVEEYITDQILVAITRADPEPLSKERLKEETGLGTSDLRAGLAQLEEQGKIEGTANGYELMPEDTQHLIPKAAQPRPPRDTSDDDPVEEEEPEAGPVIASPEDFETDLGPVCEAQISMTVRYRPDEGEDAVDEAVRIAQAARTGIAQAWPDLEVTGKVERVVEYAEPRQLYPA
ncbi:MAG TPA: hypothetical protein VF192_00960 [Longimicrobiales bacterium]